MGAFLRRVNATRFSAPEDHEQSTINCSRPAENPTCLVPDGGRLITRGEEMTISTQPDEDLLWIIRLNPGKGSTLRVSVDGVFVDSFEIPADSGGRWQELVISIRESHIGRENTRLRIEVVAGIYMPYYHWFFQR
jgi:hypothetical protein